MSDAKAEQFLIVWEFLVNPDKRGEFEKAYAPDGLWAELFATDANYIGTELVHDGDDPDRYFTIDVWRSRSAYRRFKRTNRTQYETIDRQCEALTRAEKLVVEYQTRRILNPNMKREVETLL